MVHNRQIKQKNKEMGKEEIKPKEKENVTYMYSV